MIHIERLEKPRILKEKQEEWQQKYNERLLDNPKARPESAKYAHKEIRMRLGECSSDKCFYCETKLLGHPREVDHFVEVSIDHSKAFDWENLYLSCPNCNDKVNHNVIPVQTALDPCADSNEEIRSNIFFDDELVCMQPASTKGKNTINKYHLNSDSLMLKRGKRLRMIMEAIINIQHKMIEEGRKDYTNEERLKLQAFMQPDQPYSLMCEQFIRKKCPSL